MCESSDEDMVIERVTSETEKTYDKVPADTMFTFKLKTKENKTYDRFEFVLKEGKVLPYSVPKPLKGIFSRVKEIFNVLNFVDKNVRFSRFLKPDIEKMGIVSNDENKYTFKDLDTGKIV